MKRILLCVLMATASARAAAPDWLRSLVSSTLPAYPPKTTAVVLLDEQIVTVKDSGEIHTVTRRALKILRQEARAYGVVKVPFDSDTRLTFLKAWAFPAGQAEYEVKEKDAFETGYSSGALYSDLRYKILQIPAADPGSVIGYEFEQRDRPFLLQHMWSFQETIPVRKSRFVLNLPPGWEFRPKWRNYAEKQPKGGGNQWTWEVDDVPAIESERMMPAWQTVAGAMAVTYLSRTSAGKSHANWNDVAIWFASLAAPRLASTPDIALKAAELTAAANTPWKKAAALTEFVQRQIRYVSIPIGIGSHQPNPAGAILANRYGDCKDKVTLLKSLLKQAGIESHYVLVHSRRGAVNPEFPSVFNFNHVIVAIPELAQAEGVVLAIAKDNAGRPMLLFDPTDPITPLGYLPSNEQSSHGLLVRDDGGELIHIPVVGEGSSRLVRAAKFKLSPGGELQGTVEETYSGGSASEMRRTLRSLEGQNQTKALETFLGESLSAFQLRSGTVQGLEESGLLLLRYAFQAPDYAKKTGDLLLVRPRVLGLMSKQAGDPKERKFPLSLTSTSVSIDSFQIEIPEGYEVDELPSPVRESYGFGSYTSQFAVNGSVLSYNRFFVVKQVEIPKEGFADWWKLQRAISADERSYAVLRPVRR